VGKEKQEKEAKRAGVINSRVKSASDDNGRKGEGRGEKECLTWAGRIDYKKPATSAII